MIAFLKKTSRRMVLCLTLLATPLAAKAVSYPEQADIKYINDLPLTEREYILSAAFGMIVIISLAGFFLYKRLSPRSLMALLMACLFISGVSLIFLFTSAYGENPIYGIIVVIAMLALFKLMNQFEINRK